MFQEKKKIKMRGLCKVDSGIVIMRKSTVIVPEFGYHYILFMIDAANKGV